MDPLPPLLQATDSYSYSFDQGPHTPIWTSLVPISNELISRCRSARCVLRFRSVSCRSGSGFPVSYRAQCIPSFPSLQTTDLHSFLSDRRTSGGSQWRCCRIDDTHRMCPTNTTPRTFLLTTLLLTGSAYARVLIGSRLLHLV